MKIQPYVEKLEKSNEYAEFVKKYPDSFLVAGFFILDLESGGNMHQIDFYVPSEKKIAAFTLDEGIKLQLLNTLSKKVPERLDINTNIDLDALPGILSDEMHNRGISEDIKKIIAVLQNVEGKKIWNLNCVLTGMEILRSHIEDESKTVLKLEKSSFMEIMKHVPKQAIQQHKAGDPKDELKKLEELESQINKEKERLGKELKKGKEKE